MKNFINFYDKENKSKKVGYIEFKNKTGDVGDIYIYGQIMSGSEKWDDSDITVSDFQKKLDGLGDVREINIYQNSPGGSVMAGVNILNLLNRHKAKKNVYIDSLSASISSVITMCYDELFVYPTSVLMVHEAMGFYFNFMNKTELREHAETLERIEENMLIPAYMAKANDELTENVLRDLLKKESWLGSQDIKRYFKNVTILEEEKELVACAGFDIMNKYSNTPSHLKSLIKNNNSNVESANTTEKQKLKLQLELL